MTSSIFLTRPEPFFSTENRISQLEGTTCTLALGDVIFNSLGIGKNTCHTLRSTKSNKLRSRLRINVTHRILGTAMSNYIYHKNQKKNMYVGIEWHWDPQGKIVQSKIRHVETTFLKLDFLNRHINIPLGLIHPKVRPNKYLWWPTTTHPGQQNVSCLHTWLSHSLKLAARPWKMMLGRPSFPFGKAYVSRALLCYFSGE